MLNITPEVFELAYSYRDTGMEVDHIEYNWQKDSGTDNPNVLDVRALTSEHLTQFASRGYNCTGLEISREMLDYSRQKAKNLGMDIEYHELDMHSFSLDKKFGLVINALAGANLILSNSELIIHLRSVARVLEPGGIFFLEMIHPREYGISGNIPTRSWEVNRENLSVKADITHEGEVDPVSQVQHFVTTINVAENEDETIYLKDEKNRIYLFQEFLSLVENAGGFELINCYGTFNSSVQFDSSRRSWRMLPILKRTSEEV